MCTHTRMSGSLSQRLWLQLIWESSTSGALTFHCRVKGGGGVCVWIGDRRTRKAREWQKENLHCFDQIAAETAKESCSDTRTVHARVQNIRKSPQMLAINTHSFSSICAGCKILTTLISIQNAHVLTGHAASILSLIFSLLGQEILVSVSEWLAVSLDVTKCKCFCFCVLGPKLVGSTESWHSRKLPGPLLLWQ